jgi:GTP-binding protein
VVSAIRSIERCDVALLLADGMEGLRSQDERIAGLVESRGKCCIIVVNKWDLVEKDTNTIKEYTEKIHELMPFIAYAPVVYVSALTGKRTLDIFKVVERVREQSTRKFKTAVLNKLLEQFTIRHHPPVYRGKPIKFYYMTQTGTAPQRLRIFTNYPMGVPMAYRRYLINRFREALEIDGVPLRVSFRSRR